MNISSTNSTLGELFQSLPDEPRQIPREIWLHIFSKFDLVRKDLSHLRLVNKLFDHTIIHSQELFAKLTSNSMRYVPKTYPLFKSFLEKRKTITERIINNNPMKIEVSFTEYGYSENSTFEVVDDETVILFAEERLYKIERSTGSVTNVNYPQFSYPYMEFYPISGKSFKVPLEDLKKNGFINYPNQNRSSSGGKFILIKQSRYSAIFNTLSNQFHYIGLDKNIFLKNTLAFHQKWGKILTIDLVTSTITHIFNLDRYSERIESVQIHDHYALLTTHQFGFMGINPPGADRLSICDLKSLDDYYYIDSFGDDFCDVDLKFLSEKYMYEVNVNFESYHIYIYSIPEIMKQFALALETQNEKSINLGNPANLKSIHIKGHKIKEEKPMDRIQNEGPLFLYEDAIFNFEQYIVQDLPGKIRKEDISGFVKLTSHQVITHHPGENPHFQITPIPRHQQDQQMGVIFNTSIPITQDLFRMTRGSNIDDFQLFAPLMEKKPSASEKKIFLLDLFTKTVLGSKTISKTNFYKHELSNGMLIELYKSGKERKLQKYTFSITDYTRPEKIDKKKKNLPKLKNYSEINPIFALAQKLAVHQKKRYRKLPEHIFEPHISNRRDKRGVGINIKN